MKEDSYRPGAATKLIDHIVKSHDRYKNEVVPRIEELMGRLGVTAGIAAEPLLEGWRWFRVDLERHLMQEGRVLFPAIREFEAAERAGRSPAFVGDGLDRGFRHMRAEHRQLEDALSELIGVADEMRAGPLTTLLRQLREDLLGLVGTEEEELWWQARALELRALSDVAP